MDWTVVTYRVPQEPSRHRVAIWRELRRAGAVPLQQATWALPLHRHTAKTLDRVRSLVGRADGQVFIFDADPRDDAMAADLERAFFEGREAEWVEFLAECDKFDQEIDKEIRKQKFTPAELDEEDQNLERLRRWFRDLRRRDVFGADSRQVAEGRLKECEERLEDFANRVYSHGGEM